MADADRNEGQQESHPKEPKGRTEAASAREHRSKTAGENRDYDESGESKNQGHGHPRKTPGAGPD